MAKSFYDKHLISQIYYDNVNMACKERDESAASVLLNGLRQTASLIGHITFIQIFTSVIEEYDSLKEIAAIMSKSSILIKKLIRNLIKIMINSI